MKYRLTSTVTFAQPNQAACSQKIAEIISEFRLQVHQNVPFKEHVSRPEDTEVSLRLTSKKCTWKISSAKVICFIYLLTLFTNVTIEANSVDPGQATPVGAI